jgi:hypothetical protein
MIVSERFKTSSEKCRAETVENHQSCLRLRKHLKKHRLMIRAVK